MSALSSGVVVLGSPCSPSAPLHRPPSAAKIVQDEVEEMRSGAIKKELEGLGESTRGLVEKQDLVELLVHMRLLDGAQKQAIACAEVRISYH